MCSISSESVTHSFELAHGPNIDQSWNSYLKNVFKSRKIHSVCLTRGGCLDYIRIAQISIFCGESPFLKLFENYINNINNIIIIAVRNVTWCGSFVNELVVVRRLIAKLSELAGINGRQVCGSDWDWSFVTDTIFTDANKKLSSVCFVILRCSTL